MNMGKPIYNAIVGAHRGHKWYGSKLGSGYFSIRYGIKGKKVVFFRLLYSKMSTLEFLVTISDVRTPNRTSKVRSFVAFLRRFGPFGVR